MAKKMDDSFSDNCPHCSNGIDKYTTDESPYAEDGMTIRFVRICGHPKLKELDTKDRVPCLFGKANCPRTKIIHKGECVICDKEVEYTDYECNGIKICVCNECKKAIKWAKDQIPYWER